MLENKRIKVLAQWLDLSHLAVSHCPVQDDMKVLADSVKAQ